MSNPQNAEKKPESSWLSLVFNVVIPVFILHKLSERFGPIPTLVLALSFPLGYGLFDFFRSHKLNPLSLLGFLNVTVTGGLAVLGLGGIWFSIKEACFPLLIGAFVLWSAFGKKPFIKSVFLNPQLMDIDKIQALLQQNSKQQEFEKHLKVSTIMLAGSFLLSAVMNFTLSLYIFTDIESKLSDTERALALNQQIARMTQWSFMVIMIPSMICLGFILWYLFHGIKQLTGLKIDEFMKS